MGGYRQSYEKDEWGRNIEDWKGIPNPRIHTGMEMNWNPLEALDKVAGTNTSGKNKNPDGSKKWGKGSEIKGKQTSSGTGGFSGDETGSKDTQVSRPDPDLEDTYEKLKETGQVYDEILNPKELKVGKINVQQMDPNYMGGKPYERQQKLLKTAEETVGDVGEAAGGVGLEFRALKGRLKGMREPDVPVYDPETGRQKWGRGALKQTEGFALQKKQIRDRETADIQGAEERAGGVVGSQLASTSIFGSSGGGARSRAEGRQAKLTQAGQQETRAAADQLVGTKAAEDLKLAAKREEEAEDKLLEYGEKEQNAFRIKSETERAIADAYRPDIDWQRNVASQNVTTKNQAELANLGYTTQLSAANAQSASTMFSGLAGLFKEMG